MSVIYPNGWFLTKAALPRWRSSLQALFKDRADADEIKNGDDGEVKNQLFWV